MTKTEVRCPTCKKMGEIEVPDEIIKDVSRGLLAVNIAKDTVCEHSFIAYIDKNCNVRDYFVVDFQVELPKFTSTEKFQTEIPKKEIIDIDLIRINLQALLLVNVLYAIFTKKKFIIISDLNFLKSHIINFFKYITHNSFEIDMLVMDEDEYKKNKNLYKYHFVFKENKILQNLKKGINTKKLKVEKSIINRFLTESELGYSYILLRNEILKAYELAKTIVDYYNNFSQIEHFTTEDKNEDKNVNRFLTSFVDKEKFITKLVSDYLIKIHGIKVHKYYLSFLIDIVREYFDIDIFQEVMLTSI